MSDFLDHLKSMPRLDAFAYDHPPSLLGYRLVLTCRACPEQYDVMLDCVGGVAGGGPHSESVVIGYLRLRHGHFRAEAPDCGGEILYEAFTEGDGMFDDDERLRHLTIAVMCIDGCGAPCQRRTGQRSELIRHPRGSADRHTNCDQFSRR
jgi:hypothetical protein